MANVASAIAYAALVREAAERYQLAPALLAGLVDHESNWNPRAYRFEQFSASTSADDDASRGLGQLLYRTARDLGYNGTPEGMFDPAVSLDLAAKYLDKQIRRAGGNVAGGLSAYNGGWRPADGFGQPSPHAYTVVLARNAAGQPSRTRAVRVGEYANQDYVDTVLAAARAFAGNAPWVGATNQAALASRPPAPLKDVLSPVAKTSTPDPAAAIAALTSPTAKKAALVGAGALVAFLVWRALT